MDTSEKEPRSRRWRRWLGRLALGVTALGVGLAIAVAVVLGSLDRPWLKTRIQRAVRDSAGIELDYRALRVRLFSGIWLDDLVVATPPPLRAITPELARVDHLEAVWSLSSLLGRGPKIRAVAIRGISVSLASDAAGRTSLDLLGPSPPPPPKKPAPATPLSQLFAHIFGGGPPIGTMDIDGVRAALVQVTPRGAVQRDTIDGFALHMASAPAPANDTWGAAITAGTPNAPLAIDVTREVSARGAAHLALALAARGDSQGLSLSVDIRVVSQNLAPVQIGEVVQLEAALTPDPTHQRILATLQKLTAVDGAVRLAARAELADDAAQTMVQAVDGDLDLARLVKALPAGTIPVALGGGRLQLHVAGLQPGGAVPRLAPNGAVHVAVDLPRVATTSGGGAITVSGARASVDARPSAGGGWDGEVAVLAADTAIAGPTRLTVQGARLDMRVSDLHLDPASPAASRGTVRLTADVAALDARTPGMRVVVDQLGVRLGVPLSGRSPYAAELEVPIGTLRLFDGRGRRLTATPARLALSASHVEPDGARPIASRGDVHLTVALGPLQATVDARKQSDAADLTLAVKASSLAVARSFLPPDLGDKLGWDQMAIDLQSQARVERLASAAPALRQKTTLRVDRLRAGRQAVHALTVTVQSKGDARRHELETAIAAEGVTIAGKPAPDTHLKLTAAVDRGAPTAKLRLDADGAAQLALTAAVGFDAGARRIDVDLDLKAERLVLVGALRPFVPALEGIDLARASVGLQVHAALTGILQRLTGDGDLRLASDPVRTAGGHADLAVHVADLSAAQSDSQIKLGSADLKMAVGGTAARRELSGDVDVRGLAVASGDQRIQVSRVRDDLAATLTGAPATGSAEVIDHLVVSGIAQNVAPFVAADQVTLALAAHRQADGLLQLSELHLEVPQEGTSLSVTGAADLGIDRRLSVQGRIDQDLSRLHGLPGQMSASGRLGVAFGVDSPDLEVFRAHGGLELDGVNFRAPALGVAVDSADARIPIAMRVILGPQGPVIPRDRAVNPYTSLRFADQAPLLAHDSFLSIARLTTPVVTIAPLAGNLSIDQNVVSLGQLEMGVRQGRITGQCVFDWDGDDSKVTTHIRASGVQSSRGEPFDGDAALQVALGERSIEGRAQILRIGRRHLLDLLDVVDPHRVDPAINRVRFALTFGYPDQIRIAFDHGFASARVKLGGPASLLRIDEIRGIPTGSLLDKVLTPPSKSEPD